MSDDNKEETVWVLRTCNADMTAYDGFTWPEAGPAECSDWDPKPECGHGFHGLLRGEGDGSLLKWDSDAKWLVVEVPIAKIVDLDGKVKFPRGIVVHCGDQSSASTLLKGRYPDAAVLGCTATAGDYGTATAGYDGTATAGDYGVLVIRWWDGYRYRLVIGYVGENGIEPNTPYRCDEHRNLVKANP